MNHQVFVPLNMTSGSCTGFSCDRGRTCISYTLYCDHVVDCDDLSDETNCGKLHSFPLLKVGNKIFVQFVKEEEIREIITIQRKF